MNIAMQTAIQTCLQLCANAQDFKGKVKKVTGLTTQGFERIDLCVDTYEALVQGKTVPVILRELYP